MFTKFVNRKLQLLPRKERGSSTGEHYIAPMGMFDDEVEMSSDISDEAMRVALGLHGVSSVDTADMSATRIARALHADQAVAPDSDVAPKPAPRPGVVLDLSGKVAFVTGGSRGIGRAIAKRLAQAGATVVITFQNRTDAALEVLQSLGDDTLCVVNGDDLANLPLSGWDALAIQANAAVEADVERSVKIALMAFDRIDILVNNAGIRGDGLQMRVRSEFWDNVLDTNLKSAYLYSKLVVRGMQKQGAGRIISISSILGRTGMGGTATYAAAKAGLIGYTRALSDEVGSRNITVNAVAPGFIETDLMSDMSEEDRKKAIANTSLGRLGQPEDVAKAVVFLASDDAAFITGAVLDVNGGMFTG